MSAGCTLTPNCAMTLKTPPMKGPGPGRIDTMAPAKPHQLTVVVVPTSRLLQYPISLSPKVPGAAERVSKTARGITKSVAFIFSDAEVTDDGLDSWRVFIQEINGYYVRTYREFHLLANLGWVDLDLGSSPGWWAGTVASYCPSRMVEHPKPKSTQPRFASR